MPVILWVEDDERIRRAAERLCRAAAVRVGFCHTYEEAESVLTYGEPCERYPAIVSDFDLGPGPTGADVLAAAKRAGIPIRILCSGGPHSIPDAPAATSFYDKSMMWFLVETVLAPLFKEVP